NGGCWSAPPQSATRMAATSNPFRRTTMLNRSLNSTLDRMMVLNRALDEAFTNGASADTARVWVPAVDLIEKKDAYLARLELPGVERSSIDISFEKNVLTVGGTKPAMTEGSEEEI